MEFAQLLIPAWVDCFAPDVIDSHDGNKLIFSSWISRASGSMCFVFHPAGLCSPSEIIHLCPRWLFASSTFLQKADSAGCPLLIYQWFRYCSGLGSRFIYQQLPMSQNILCLPTWKRFCQTSPEFMTAIWFKLSENYQCLDLYILTFQFTVKKKKITE